MTREKNPEEVAAGIEVDVEEVAKMLGIAIPLVLRRMNDGRLPFRQEGARRLARREDVGKLKADIERQDRLLRAAAETDEVDFQPEPKL
jgi:predicted site-specific integrase-resolvase